MTKIVVLKKYYANCQVQIDYNIFLSHSKKCTVIILSVKNEYILKISKKLNDPSTAPKSYWSILNWFPNNKKIHSIPSIFHNGKVTPDFKEKLSFHTNTRLNSFSTKKKLLLYLSRYNQIFPMDGIIFQ